MRVAVIVVMQETTNIASTICLGGIVVILFLMWLAFTDIQSRRK